MNLAQLKAKELHFIGVGGSGMSGLARIALAMGIHSSGCDAKDSQTLADLRNLGLAVFVGHSDLQITENSIVVVSSAVSPSNPEILKAKALGIPILSRAEALAIFMESKKSIAVAGTHGKTTTTSMLAVGLQSLGLDPSFSIGGTINRGGTNAHLGSGEYFVAEADESDGSFVTYRPAGAIITNIELDHVDNFPNLDAIMQIFESFVTSIAANGFLVVGTDSPQVLELLRKITRKDLRIISYGKSNAELTYSHLSLGRTSAMARIAHNGKILGELEISVPGEHNIENALAVIGVGVATEQPITQLMAGLHNFTGARRRFEIKGIAKGITVIDDYGHHPTEIAVTLTAAKNYAQTGRVLVIFQPHRYSRTAAFIKEFGEALSLADKVYLLEIYSAGENPIPGVSAKNIANQIPGAIFNPSMVEVVTEVARSAKPGDAIITLGAGDVSALAPVILENLNAS